MLKRNKLQNMATKKIWMAYARDFFATRRELAKKMSSCTDELASHSYFGFGSDYAHWRKGKRNPGNVRSIKLKSGVKLRGGPAKFTYMGYDSADVLRHPPIQDSFDILAVKTMLTIPETLQRSISADGLIPTGLASISQKLKGGFKPGELILVGSSRSAGYNRMGIFQSMMLRAFNSRHDLIESFKKTNPDATEEEILKHLVMIATAETWVKQNGELSPEASEFFNDYYKMPSILNLKTT